MNDNATWGLVIAAVGGAGYYAYTRSRPNPMSIEEAEMIAPAPYSTEGDDSLTPGDFSPYPSGAIGLTETEPFNRETGSQYPGIWQPGWNTPEKPAGNHDNYDKPEKPTQQRGPQDMKLGTANIKNYKDIPKKRVMRAARKVGSLTGIWGGQEIQPGEDTGPVLQALGADWKVVHGSTETPIFYRSNRWQAFDEHAVRLDRGNFEKVNKRSSVTSVAFRNVNNPTIEFAVVNCHLIPGGFNGGSDNVKRRAQWRKEFDIVRRVIKYHHDKGRLVFFLGDTNHVSCPVPLRGARWITNGGIDKIGVFKNKRGSRIVRFIGNPNGQIHTNPSGERFHPIKVINVRLK